MSEAHNAVPEDGYGTGPGGQPLGPGGLPATPPPLARCYRHPMRETGVRCVRCDRPICPECMRPASVGFQCPDDVKLDHSTQRAPRTVAGAVATGSRVPYVTATIVALNVTVYLATALPSVRGFNYPYTTKLFQNWVLQPNAVGLNDQFYRLITAAFLHENLLHIAFNMFALVMVGPHLERLLGAWRFTAVYLLGALGGSVAVYLFGERYTAVVGASGAIFGLFAACLLFVRELGFDSRSLIGTIVINFVFTFSIGGISKLGHVGGFVLGALAAMAIAGLPNNRRRLPLTTQLAALGGLFALLVIGVVIRSQTI